MTSVLEVTKSGGTIPKAIFVSLLLGSVPAGIVAWTTGNWWDGSFGTGLAVATLFGAASLAWKTGWNTNVSLGSLAVHQSFGHPTGKLYGPGELYGVPGKDKYTLVLMKERPTDVEMFQEPTADGSEIFVSGFFSVATSDPFKTFRIGDPTLLLTESFETAVRSFVNVWCTSSHVKEQKQLLHRFMRLPADQTNLQHVDFRIQLMKLTVPSESRTDVYLTEDGVDGIMQAAGAFVADIERIGLYLVEARIDEANVDPIITKSINERAAETERMKQVEIRNMQRIKLAKAFLDADTSSGSSRLNMRDAVNFVDRGMDLGVKTTITEIDVRDAQLIAETLKAVSESTSKTFMAWLERQNKGGTP